MAVNKVKCIVVHVVHSCHGVQNFQKKALRERNMKRNECSCVVSVVCQSAVFIHHFAAMQIYLHYIWRPVHRPLAFFRKVFLIACSFHSHVGSSAPKPNEMRRLPRGFFRPPPLLSLPSPTMSLSSPPPSPSSSLRRSLWSSRHRR